ncbi:MAG: PTS glucose transporter subunit IIA [Clostridia bacterium]|nr:PTS glucose transporter subunit IIA [Clostridia bacterium]
MEHQILAPMSGRAVALEAVPDEVFAAGMLGIGFAVEAAAGEIFAPVSGVLETVADSLHAYTIHTDDGLDVLVHVGIDTVTLRGEPFTVLVSPGTRVRAGERIARVDLDALRTAGLPTVTPVVITNPDTVTSPRLTLGAATGGETVVMQWG